MVNNVIFLYGNAYIKHV
uniref:Uncharacterized protein n=1 Tax=Anguilla anguilla TaxID=7936 RepID=A0A0E9W546_ANGAN